MGTLIRHEKEQPLFKRVFFSIYSYTIIYAMFGVLSLSYHACFNSSLSTLEKRYHFSSSTGGLIMITDNIATVLTNLFIGYYGKTAHKPRWMSIGCVVTGLSVMITALPYFIYGPAQQQELELVANMTLRSKSIAGDQMCLTTARFEDCTDISASKTMTAVAVSCFAISNFFRGFGTSIYFTYGTPYLDDNVSKSKMPSFFAFIFAGRILGAPIGFYLSSLALKYYENPFARPDNLVDTDPRWIGAWWIGFLVAGSMMLLLAIPLSFFPREFKKNLNNEIEDGDEKVEQRQSAESTQLVERNVNGQQVDSTISSSNNPQQVELVSYNTTSIEKTNKLATFEKKEKPKQDLSLKELPGEILAIITNPIIICQMMGNLFRGIGIIGYFVFQTKYLESQFRQSASKASLVSGTTGFAAKIFGVLFGGILISLCRPAPRVLTTFIFFVELTSVFTLLYGASVMGPQYSYPHTLIKSNDQLELSNQCNKNCFCDHVRYQPVCQNDEMKAYFSPCHAGCKNSYRTPDGGSAFTECSCSDSPSKTLEKCPPDTERLMKYATIVALGGMISGSSRPGNMVTFFRSINPDQKSLAVAVGSFWHSLFVSIPYPIIYGKIFDYTCLVWAKECNKRGNCWLYDTTKLRYIYHGVSIALIAMGSVFDFIMIFLSHRLGNLYDETENNKSTFKDRVMFWKSKKEPKSAIEDGNKSPKRDADQIDEHPVSSSSSTDTKLKITKL